MSYPTKRFLDVAVASVLLIVLLPVFLLVVGLVVVGMGRPVLFRQVRPGRDGKPFAIVKFRTMKNARDAEGRPLPDKDRLTRLGRLLRSTSLDELPELLNVLKGEMSLVGPRPLHMEYLPYYDANEVKRLAVLPGITGWAQINGRNYLPWDERLACDVWYVEHCSLALDLKILGLTAIKTMSRENVEVDADMAETNLAEERRHRVTPRAPSSDLAS